MNDHNHKSHDSERSHKKGQEGKRLYFLKELNFGDKRNYEKEMRKYYLIKYEQQNKQFQVSINGEF